MANAPPAPTAYDSREVDLNDVTLRYDVSGKGPPLYLIHGGPTGSRTYWRGALAALERTHTLHAIDLRGHGESGRVPPYTLQNIALDLASFADALGHPEPILLGHSFGSLVALRAAIDHPHRFSRLVLVGAFPRTWRVLSDPRHAGAKWRIAHAAATWYAAYKTGRAPDTRAALREVLRHAEPILHAPTTPAWVDEHLFASVLPPYDALEPLAWEVLGWDVLAECRRIRAPTLLVHGEHDALAKPDAARLEARIPDCRRAVIPGAGHSPFLEAPDAFARAVAPFLRGE